MLQMLLWLLGWVCPPLIYFWGFVTILAMGKDKENAQCMKKCVLRLVSKFLACTRGFLVHAWGVWRTCRRKLGIGQFVPKWVPMGQ